jgi:hypothetical protein
MMRATIAELAVWNFHSLASTGTTAGAGFPKISAAEFLLHLSLSAQGLRPAVLS